MSNTTTVTLEVLRYDPERDQEPRFQSFEVPYDEDWVVLDALNWIKDNTDSTLTYRWSCHMAVCGSCGMVVNGEEKLTCKAFLRDYLGRGPIRVEPLRNFPIERDLVVDMEGFMAKLESVKPWIIRDEEKPVEDGEYIQLPKQLKRFKHHTLCINCLLCYSACPQVGLNPGFIGPAALALAHRYNLDSRDQGRHERQEVTGSADGVWECTFVSACSDVCPKHVEPGGAIQEQKIANSVDWFLDHLIPGRSSAGRTKE
ncbi:succinate dehydrogenase/fumarate reductase iron-sulfur subunit [Novispirillum itersonii]|uniref:succinate dehydrogenase/fumarate reductase iron-sulfur subunit n=1 Tax=Novispirillum itersonii TaxID=189 RepID=UPI00036E5F68|nr:succinate dehydrogenase/fumarate reductase iron-sulfur subunit [Novispirillum itersonii]